MFTLAHLFFLFLQPIFFFPKAQSSTLLNVTPNFLLSTLQNPQRRITSAFILNPNRLSRRRGWGNLTRVFYTLDPKTGDHSLNPNALLPRYRGC